LPAAAAAVTAGLLAATGIASVVALAAVTAATVTDRLTSGRRHGSRNPA